MIPIISHDKDVAKYGVQNEEMVFLGRDIFCVCVL